MTVGNGRFDFDNLYHAVLDRLADGRYPLGGRISVKQLADSLKVSPTPLREILSRLVGRGLVEERRSEGYYLARLDPPGLADLYRLHGHCVDLALRLLLHVPPHDDPADDAWAVLANLVRASERAILQSVQTCINERLRIVRRCERQVCDEAAAIIAWETAKRQDDLGLLRKSVARFYKTRIAASRHIVELANARASPF